MTKPELVDMGVRLTAHALHVGDRINTMGFEGETLSAVPLAVRVGATGIAVLFRYGVAVLIGLSPADERVFLEQLRPRIGGQLARFEEETAIVTLAGETEDQVRALIRASRARGTDLARALQAAQAGRSARKEGGGVRVQLDPAELI